jgi:ketosteroid isomerase-like protein
LFRRFRSTVATREARPAREFAQFFATMKIAPLLFSLGIGILFPLASHASTNDSIRAVLDAQAAAWNRGEIDGFMAGYDRSPATTFVSGDEVHRGWQVVRDRYAKKYNTRAKMGRLTFSGLTITPLCADAAIALGSWSLARNGDHPHGKFTLLFRKRREGWRIVLDHTS